MLTAPRERALTALARLSSGRRSTALRSLGLSDGQAIELERKPLAAGIGRGATLIEPDAPGKPFTLEVVDSV